MSLAIYRTDLPRVKVYSLYLSQNHRHNGMPMTNNGKMTAASMRPSLKFSDALSGSNQM